jgi:hypothetical protein
VGNLAGTIIAVVAGLILVAVVYVQHELHGPASRPAPVYAASAARRVRRARTARRVAPGDSCICGGTVGRTVKTSTRFGCLLGCTGCARSWTMDGRRILWHRSTTLPGGGHDGRRAVGVPAAVDVLTAGDEKGEGPW